MRCKARVDPKVLAYRASDDRLLRCSRRATKDGYCYQHWPLYKMHRGIVARILAIRPRDILGR